MSPHTIWRLDVETLSDEQLITATTLQGLANRQQPRVYLSVIDRHWSMKFRTGAEIGKLPGGVLERPYRSCTDIWEDYYASVHGLEFRPARDLEHLLQLCREHIAGCILIDMTQRGQFVVGATLAGLRNAVLVTADTLAASPLLQSLPVLEDLQGRFADSFQAHQWAAEHLLPQCNRRAIFSQTRTANEGDPDYFSLDLAVSQRLFVFSLCFRQCREPRQFALIEEILARIEPCSPMYGWGTSEESMMVGMAKSGSLLVCTHTPNISFHAVIQPTRPDLAAYLPPRRPRPRLQHKHYVTFMVNEGDTLKWMGNVMGHGQWLSPERGAVPANWGTNPWLVEKYPGMMELFYRTATDRECFFSSITGYGYYSPKHCRQTLKLAQLEKQHNPAAGLTVGSIYSVHGMMDAVHGKLDPQTDQWLVERGCRGYAFESAQQAYVQYTSAGQPVIGVDWSLFYWMYRFEGMDPLEGAARRIQQIADEHEPPFFIPVYAGTPTQFKQMAAMLPSDRFEIVLLDEMVELALEARPLLQSRTPRRAPTPPAVKRPNAARVIQAPRYGPDVWRAAPVIDHDLARWGVGQAHVHLQLAWDEQHLHVRIVEQTKVPTPLESLEQRSYEAGEFDVSDGVALWMDLTGTGTKERGDFTAWLGFSSLGRRDVYCSLLNDRVLSCTQPAMKVTTDCIDGRRTIEAAIPWAGLAQWLEAGHQPEGGLQARVGEGFTFGCQPLLIEGAAGRAFLNGRSNKRQNETAAALERQGRSAIPAPDGFDAASITVQLVLA